MKTRIETEEKEFKPFDIIITIENKRELEIFWTFFCSSNTRQAIFLNATGRTPHWSSNEIAPFTQAECQSILNTTTWKVLDNKLKEISE